MPVPQGHDRPDQSAQHLILLRNCRVAVLQRSRLATYSNRRGQTIRETTARKS